MKLSRIRSYVFAAICTMLPVAVPVYSQAFTDIEASLREVYLCSLDWGDYDNDGDLDLVLTGRRSGSYYSDSEIYRNDSGEFTDAGYYLTGVSSGCAIWGDYDNDGDLDILLTGYASSERVAKIYVNDDGSFNETDVGLGSIASSNCSWDDFDNDGDLDILISGYNSDYITEIYINDDGNYVPYDSNLPQLEYAYTSWEDLDRDGDLDILLSGKSGYNQYVVKIYINEHGSFTEVEVDLPEILIDHADWADFDNDGDPDLLLAGSIYENDSLIFIEIIDVGSDGQSYWGDYDNDGDLDVLSVDRLQSTIFENQDNVFIETGIEFESVNYGDARWGDYDADGDLDIVIAGEVGYSTSKTTIYRNDTASSNSIPSVPGNLDADTLNSTVHLSWDRASDNETPVNSLSYNVYIGTSAGTENIVSSMSDIGDGYRRIVKCGNAYLDTNKTIRGLPDGKYYWSVQSVDHNFAGSGFAAEESFTILSEEPDDPVTGLQQDSISSRYIGIAWDRIECENYIVFARMDSGETQIPVNNISYDASSDWNSLGSQLGASEFYCIYNGSDTIAHLFNLTQSTEYQFLVFSYNGAKGYEKYNKTITSENNIAETTLFEQFSELIDPPFEDLSDSHCAWGDYDNDGDMDLLICGDNGTEYITKLYNNENGTFTDSEAGLNGIRSGCVAFGDYDNDNDLDIYLSGYTGSGGFNRLYNNDNGTFTEIFIGMPLLYYCSGNWGDYDNDGDLDLLATGYFYNGVTNKRLSTIYRNDGGIFTDADPDLEGVSNSSAEFGDYDNDGDLDILLTGYTGSKQISLIYNNSNGAYSETANSFTGVSSGRGLWFDADKDGDLDIVFAGYTGSGEIAMIYENNAGEYTATDDDLIGVTEADVVVGDYDNDGDLDLLLTGYTGSEESTVLYENTGGAFSESGVQIQDFFGGSAAFADIDNDGDPDLLICGQADGIEKTMLYINNSGIANTAPTVPQNLSSVKDNANIHLSWDKASDNETSEDGLTYNILVYNETDSIISPPMADTTTGVRLVPQPGKVNNNCSWVMSGIQEGKYYWTVQSIDNSFAGSGFADPDTFDFHLDPPVVQAYDLVADSVSWNDMTLSWKRGSGTSCAVFMKEGSSGNPLPSDDSVYYASQDWSDKGSEIQGSGYYCIYNGTDSTVFVSGLDYNTPFHIKVFEFNGWDKRTRYNLSDSINNPLEITTPDVLYPPSPDFSVSDSTGYAPFSISFYNKTSYYTSSFLWDFGDGDSSTLENPHHSYSDPGIYSVKLAAANPVGTKDTVYENLVKVWPALPGVYFSADVRSGDAPLQVTFTNLSDEEAEEYFWDFGDGSTSTGKNPVHTYWIPGDYTVSLTQLSSGGYKTYTRSSYIDVETGAEEHTLLPGQWEWLTEYVFVRLTEAGSISWNYGSYFTISDATFEPSTGSTTIRYKLTVNASTPPGIYPLTVTVRSGIYVFSFNYSIRTAESPDAGFSAGIKEGSSPFTVYFTDNSSGSISSRLWNFGDGSTSTLEDPVHTYDKPGEYSVCLTVGNSLGFDTYTRTRYINVTLDESPGIPVLISPENETGSINAYTDLLWRQSDSARMYHLQLSLDSVFSAPLADTFISANSLRTPELSYNTNYYWRLRSVNEVGISDWSAVWRFLLMPVPAEAEFEANKVSGLVPLTIDFSDLSTGSISNWSWDFGDGGTSVDQKPGHTYSMAGTFTVSLTVSGDGGVDTETKTNYITVTVPPPVASFWCDPCDGEIPLTVNFTSTSTGVIFDYAWDFGDGGTSVEQNPSHTYSIAGTYTVSLTVSGDGGVDTETKTNYITVTVPPPVASFWCDPCDGEIPLTVNFTSTSTGVIFDYAWDFGDGGTSVEQNPSHTYSIAGTYTVALTVSGDGGVDTETKTDYILTLGPSSIDKDKTGHAFRIYPNPARSSFLMELSLKQTKNVRITLINIQGQVVRIIHGGILSPGYNELPVDISGLPAGLYNVSLTTDSGHSKQKLMIIE